MLKLYNKNLARVHQTGIIPPMIYDFRAGKNHLFIGVRGFISAGLPRIAPAS
jgi:hypothetical protein